MTICTALHQLFPLDDDAQTAFLALLHRHELPRGVTLLSEGHTNEDVHFIESGLVRGFYFRDDHDITAWMATEGRFIWPLPSYLLHRPSTESIELLEHSTILTITHQDLTALKQNYPVFAEVERRVMERYIMLYDKRVQLFQIPNAKDRLAAFELAFPDLAHRPALRYIASFLGIDPSTLSRIRGNFKKR